MSQRYIVNIVNMLTVRRVTDSRGEGTPLIAQLGVHVLRRKSDRRLPWNLKSYLCKEGRKSVILCGVVSSLEVEPIWWINGSDGDTMQTSLWGTLPLITSQWWQNWNVDTAIVSEWLFFNATCSQEVCQPAHPLSPMARVDMQPGILDHRSNNLRTWQWWWEWGVTLIPVLGYLGVSTSCLYWQEKSYNLIFCFGNWVWPVLLSDYIPVIHTSGGSLVLPVSASVMWWEMFRHALLWKPIWRSPRIWRI